MSDQEFTAEDLERPQAADRRLVDVAPDFDPAAVAATIARRHGISTAILLAPNMVPGSRRPTPARARRELFRALRDHGWSSPEIGDFVGGRDHSTVLAGLRKGSGT